MPGIINYNQIKQVVDIKSNASEFLYCYLNILKGVCFTVSIKFVVHKLPSFLIDKKNITSASSHELRFEPRSTTQLHTE